jgi:hypothetical protein
MRNLIYKKMRFVKVVDIYSSLYVYTNSKEQLIISSGVLNFIWNYWNNFWRDYWITHVSGGYNMDGSYISPIYSKYNDKQCCHYLLFACGKRKQHNYGDSINGSYQEVTWGDPKIIADIASHFLTTNNHMNIVLGLLSHYKTFIEHFQIIRNSFIHLNNDNIYYLNKIAGYYIFGPNHRLIDILDTKEISSSTICFINLTDNMKGMIRNL